MGPTELPTSTKSASSVSAGTWLFAGILLLAVLLRLYKLAEWPVYQDELYTLHDSVEFGEQFNLRPFYYFLQFLLLKVTPDTPLYLRIQPFLYGVLGVWVTYELGRRVFGVPAGLIAAFLVSISAWHLYASQFARYWTLVYLLAVVVYLVLLHALDTDRVSGYVLMLVLLMVGALTHPSFAFPMFGAFASVLFVSSEGRVGLSLPSRRGLFYFWGPLAVVGLIGVLYLFLSGIVGALNETRGLVAALRIVPAMVQWTSPPVVAVAAVGGAYLLFKGVGSDRRWGALAWFAWITGSGLMMVMSASRSVYADYGMAMLPLVYVTVGGFTQRVAEKMTSGQSYVMGVVTLVLAAAVLPGTVSHLSDGTRFDYRPAYSYIERVAGDRPVLGWPGTIQRYYAPDLDFETVRADPQFLADKLEQNSGFWLVASFRRYGMVGDVGGGARWLDANCRKVLTTERPRLDYRTYRVELHWCGADPPPREAAGN
jgi:hypothetical protein